MKISATIIPTDLVRNLLLCSFCPFLQTKNKNPFFQQVGGVVTRNTSLLFIASRALLQSPYKTDFYKEIFLHVIPVRIIVP